MNKPLILVVEDDPSIRNLITTTLKTNDYRYVVAPSGSTAIMETTSHNPEIILLDLGLPDMDGVQVIQTVRSWSNTPIIVISARSEDNDKIHALDAGADDYLTKPFSVEELLARLRVTQRRLALMTTEMVTSSSVFVNGKLKVDYAGGCAYLDENELHLTPIEYKLLCLLSKNVGKVLTHGSIFVVTYSNNLSQFSKIVPTKTASLRYAVCGCCLCIKNANCYNITYLLRVPARLPKESDQVFNFLIAT